MKIPQAQSLSNSKQLYSTYSANGLAHREFREAFQAVWSPLAKALSSFRLGEPSLKHARQVQTSRET